jgi:hypothetical protein
VRPSGLGSPPELSLLPLVESRPPLVGFVPAVRTSHHGSRRDPTSGRRTTPPPTPKHAAVASVAFRVTATERPLPRASLRASVPRSHPRDPVPSSWFRTTSTGSSARRSRACCIPLPVMGFAAFRVADFPGPRRCSGQSPTTAGRTDIVPAAPLTPPEGILASSRTTSPWPLPPCRSKRPPSTRDDAPLPVHRRELRETAPSTSRPCSAVEFGRPPTVAGRRCALSFHGLCSPPRSFLDARIRAGALPGHASVSICVDGETSEDNSPERHRSVPHRRSDLSLPARPIPLAGDEHGGDPSARSEDRDRGRLGPTSPTTREPP